MAGIYHRDIIKIGGIIALNELIGAINSRKRKNRRQIVFLFTHICFK